MDIRLERKNENVVTQVCRIPPKIDSHTYISGFSAQKFIRTHKISFSLTVILLIVVAWSPWISEEYATSVVVDSLGGPQATYYYLGENVTIEEIPIYTRKVPFAILVYFPGEAMFIVPFWGVAVGVPSLGLGTYGD